MAAKGVSSIIDFSGTIYVSAKVDYDKERKTLKLHNISYRRDLDNVFLSYLTWVAYRPLQRMLTKGFEFDWAEQEIKLLQEVNKQLSFSGDRGLQLQGRLDKLNFSEVVLQEDNLFLYVYTEGLVTATLK